MSGKVVNLSSYKTNAVKNKIKARRAVRERIREIAALSINQAFIESLKVAGVDQLDRQELLHVFVAEMRRRVVLPLTPRRRG